MARFLAVRKREPPTPDRRAVLSTPPFVKSPFSALRRLRRSRAIHHKHLTQGCFFSFLYVVRSELFVIAREEGFAWCKTRWTSRAC